MFNLYMQGVLGIRVFSDMNYFLDKASFSFLPPVRKTVAQMETGLKTRFLKPDWHSDPMAALFIIQDVY